MMFLKLLITFSFLTIAHGSTDEEIKSKFIHHLVLCNIEHPVNSQELEMMQKHVWPPGTNAKCLVACIFKKIHWINKKGEFDVKEANALAEKEYDDNNTKVENAKKVIDICKKVNSDPVTDGKKGCDRAFHLATCFLDNAPQLGFTI